MSRKPLSRTGKVLAGIFWFVVIILVLGHFAPTRVPALPDYSYSGPATLRQTADDAYTHLLEACPRIAKVAADIAAVDMHWETDDGSFRRQAYGWKKDLWVHMDVKQNHTAPEWGPSRDYYDSEPVDFILGAGKVPGIDLFGVPALILCDQRGHNNKANSGGGFKPVPVLSAIDHGIADDASND